MTYEAEGSELPGGTADSAVPVGFEYVAAALRDDVAGTGRLVRERARQIATASVGAPIEGLLDDLAHTWRLSTGISTDPPFALVRLFSAAWADASLRYLHQTTCENPLTGLATLAHIRTTLVDLYRMAEREGREGPLDRVLVVIELERPADDLPHLDDVVRMIDLGELMRRVYSADEIIGQLSDCHAVALVRQDRQHEDSLAVLLGHLHDWRARTGVQARLRIESLPASLADADAVLDALAR